MSVLLIVLLVALNGLFAMAEMALVSARKARLQNLADAGDAGAAMALQLNEHPARFLSTVQVGITVVGILSGAVGESALAEPLAHWFGQLPVLAPHARGLALAITVVVLTYGSVVLGELLPKQLALLAPETIAARMARPMAGLARWSHPLVLVLSGSCTLLLRLLGARAPAEPPVTDDEIKVLMEQGAEAGVFHASEQAIVSNVLRLDQQRVTAIMTPRHDMVMLDLAADAADLHAALSTANYARLLVCRGGMEHVLGLLQVSDLLPTALAGQRVDEAEIVQHLQPPLYLPASATITQLLEHFRAARLAVALIVDEYGELQGMVTLTDVLAAIVGELAVPAALAERDMVQRDDGSWLVDGDVSLPRLKIMLDLDETLPGEAEQSFHTVGGLIMHQLGRVPAEADHFHVAGWRFEVVDMDRNRVDKVLLAPIAPSNPRKSTP